MGNNPSLTTSCMNGCLGLNTYSVSTFPSVSAITEYDKLQAKLSTQFQIVGRAMSAPIPYAGGAIAGILPILAAISFGEVNTALTKANIAEQITDNEMRNIDSELSVIQNKLGWVQNQRVMTGSVVQHELLYAQSRLETIFAKFQNRGHVLRRYPLVSLPQFAQITGALWSTSQITGTLYPAKRMYNDKLTERIDQMISQMCKEFLEQRMRNIRAEICTEKQHRRQCVIQDSPWEGYPFRGNFMEYYKMTPYTPNCRTKLVNDLECYYGAISNTGYVKADKTDYVDTLKSNYASKFIKMFPLQPRIDWS